MEHSRVAHVIKDAEEYGRLVTSAFATCPKKKHYTPINRIKVPLKNVTESVTVARLLGELCAGERILSTIKKEELCTYSSIEEYRDTILGELQIFVMELNNTLAKRGKNYNSIITIEDIVEER